MHGKTTNDGSHHPIDTQHLFVVHMGSSSQSCCFYTCTYWAWYHSTFPCKDAKCVCKVSREHRMFYEQVDHKNHPIHLHRLKTWQQQQQVCISSKVVAVGLQTGAVGQWQMETSGGSAACTCFELIFKLCNISSSSSLVPPAVVN